MFKKLLISGYFKFIISGEENEPTKKVNTKSTAFTDLLSTINIHNVFLPLKYVDKPPLNGFITFLVFLNFKICMFLQFYFKKKCIMMANKDTFTSLPSPQIPNRIY